MAIDVPPAVETDELMILSKRNSELQTESTTEVEFPAVQVLLLACLSDPGEKWLQYAQGIVCKAKLSKGDNISWAAYHASMQKPTDRLPAITSVMPLFKQKAATLKMIGHDMLLIQNATEHLNPGQTPIIALDQPLYATSKSMQWGNEHPVT